MSSADWEPPVEVSRAEVIAISDRVLARADLPIRSEEYRFRIRVADLDWDIGGMLYEPLDAADVTQGADGRKVGVFLLHGGGGDHRGKHRMGQFLAAKFGYRVATMSYPGHLYFPDPAHDWPGDTINADGTCRTPLWNIDRPITRDQYDLVKDRTDPILRAKYGTLFFLRARENTDFYYRMAAWPWAFEEAMKDVCRRFFAPDAYSIYVHGHSTGGPFAHMLLQRVANVAGLLGMESSPFGLISSRNNKQGWDFPFNYLNVRTWRDTARYAGPEGGMPRIRTLAWLMEDVLDTWAGIRTNPGFKAQHFVTFAAIRPLGEAARVTARRLGMTAPETESLVERFQGYTRELSGPGVRAVPPLLYGINKGSRDHTRDKYENGLLPQLAGMRPAPRARVVYFDAGVHSYERPEPSLPRGTLPAVAEIWDLAILEGYYLKPGLAGVIGAQV